MAGFEDFVMTELPKRPFAETDGAPGQVLMRSTRPERPRELVWADLPGVVAPQRYEAGENLSGHRMVLLDATRRAVYADNESAAHAFVVIGMTRGAAQAGDDVEVVREEELFEPSWAWVVGGVLYLGKNGGLTQTPPSPPALFSLVVGWATAPDRMFVSVGTPIFLSQE